MSMFCYQCQETAKNRGCTIAGVCGKKADTANLQDLLIYVVKGVSLLADIGRKQDVVVEKADKFMFEALFMTITNANFDPGKILNKVREGFRVRDFVKKELQENGVEVPEKLPEPASWFAENEAELLAKSASVGVLKTADEDIRSLKELVTYGLKGMAAYAEHAYNLGYRNDAVFAFMHRALATICDDTQRVDTLIPLVLETGEYGVQVMALLDKANTESYGNPEITRVNLGVRKNPGILISGHDLKDMEELLEQTLNSGVDIYTHGEMLPANYYPAFKKYPHFVGNYGNSWWKQKEEFEPFHGPVLFTTNCIVPPKDSYKDRIYTSGSAGFEGCVHIPDREDGKAKDFSRIIEHAKRCVAPEALEEGELIGGFAHNQVLALADKVVAAVKSGAIRKFIVMAGCDGRMKDRLYYEEFAKKLPKDTVILTAGCAKYRYNKLPLGDIGGIPRVLDAGQCNDSYSLAVIALKLKEVFGLKDLNELPIAYNIAWYEQKAVIVLLALLYLGVKNIHLGPTLPAFISPAVKNVLVEKFGLSGIGDVDTDMKELLN
ncbi:MAG: hydroxylamine reductase [Candidatus Marinimicrobia bacterium]|nr:hydroxylamine reductase [Candidatus Neomarinimicrobiota bacterium]MDD4960623.1 hydroxylamine reductase [Candidatus Neomarinimicrobiota bacterium]MDD5709595.1 hydroxylamine reductase [Candidatus Neomarinimicrobiota bacterium]MDX9777455.1 hydroxylamine reductase [bacterium]